MTPDEIALAGLDARKIPDFEKVYEIKKDKKKKYLLRFIICFLRPGKCLTMLLKGILCQ